MASLLIILLLVTGSDYDGQPAAHSVIDVMAECGFENTRVSTSSNVLTVEYENRVYYREKDAVRLIITKIMELAPSVQTLILVSKRDDASVFQVAVSRDNYLASMGHWDVVDSLEISQETAIADSVSAGPKRNSSAGKVDIALRPELRALLGRYDDPFIYQFAISPELSTFLGKGIGGHVQALFLLHDELSYNRRRVSLSSLALDYTYRSPAPIFANLGMGYFGDNRYGLSAEAFRFVWGNRLGIGGAAAWLGTMYYWDNTLHYTKMWKWTALANIHYRLPRWDVLFTTRFGQFLFRDRGISIEMTRFFHNTGITVFAAKTNDGSIGGVEVQILTYPRRHPGAASHPGKVAYYSEGAV